MLTLAAPADGGLPDKSGMMMSVALYKGSLLLVLLRNEDKSGIDVWAMLLAQDVEEVIKLRFYQLHT